MLFYFLLAQKKKLNNLRPNGEVSYFVINVIINVTIIQFNRSIQMCLGTSTNYVLYEDLIDVCLFILHNLPLQQTGLNLCNQLRWILTPLSQFALLLHSVVKLKTQQRYEILKRRQQTRKKSFRLAFIKFNFQSYLCAPRLIYDLVQSRFRSMLEKRNLLDVGDPDCHLIQYNSTLVQLRQFYVYVMLVEVSYFQRWISTSQVDNKVDEEIRHSISDGIYLKTLISNMLTPLGLIF